MTAKSKEIIKPYLKHDEDAISDGKISKMMFTFRKLSAELPADVLQKFLPHAAYGIYWQILEFMYSNKFKTENIEIMADELRIPPEYVKKILDDFDLFEFNNDEYVSLRLLKDKEKRNEIKTSATDAINTRWLLAELNKAYKEFFGCEPILKTNEIEILKDYSKTIPDFKTKLRDIIYTVKNIKFDTKTNFTPSINWLLKDNNLTRVLNGEWGKLLHKPTEQELKEEEIARKKEIIKAQQPSELGLKISKIDSREDALDFIHEFYAEKNKPLFISGKLVVNPHVKELCEKFDISNSEILKIRGTENG